MVQLHPIDESPPAQLGRYRVVQRLGAGGMAEVFLAKSSGAEGIEKLLVVKRILPTYARQPKFIAMFVDEAKVALRLNHPNIVQVYAFEQVRSEFLLAMEYVDGPDLNQLFSHLRRRGRRLPWGISAYVAMEIAKALDYAHRRRDEQGEPLDIVHRDVSPQNVLLSPEGSVKLADFGIAKARLGSQETGVVKGKFSYMSPEQARGENVDARSDIYSLGVLLSELLMGRRMYPHQRGADVLVSVKRGEKTLPRQIDPTIPVELDRIASRAMAAAPEDRFASSRALAGALGQFLHQQNQVFDAEALEAFLARTELRRPSNQQDPAGRKLHIHRTFVPAAEAAPEAPSLQHRERRQVLVISGRWRSESSIDAGSITGDSIDTSVVTTMARLLSDLAFKADAVLDVGDSAGAGFRLMMGLGRVTDGSPQRAVHLAMDVVDACQGIAAELPQPLALSLGISRGALTTTRDLHGRLLACQPVGDVAHVADRLAAAATPWEVLVSGEVYRLVRREFSFADASALRVPIDTGTTPRGTQPIQTPSSVERPLHEIAVHRLRGLRTPSELAALARSQSVGTNFVGRERELRRVSQIFSHAVTTQRSQFLLVHGDQGVGKSALVSAVLSKLTPLPRVIRSECTLASRSTSMSMILEVIRDVCGVAEGDDPERIRQRIKLMCSDLFAAGADRQRSVSETLELLLVPRELTTSPGRSGADDAPTSAPLNLGRVLSHLLSALARRRPLVLVVDGLQWIDADSWRWLRRLLARQPRLAMLVVLVSRSLQVDDDLPASCEALLLQELSEDDRRVLLRRRFGEAAMPVEVEQSILTRGGGNPLFLMEVVEAMLGRGALRIETDQGRSRVVWQAGASFALPTTLEGVIAARLHELPELERLALRWLAVASGGWRTAELSALAGTDLSSPLQRLERNGIVQRRSDESLVFANAVERQVAYESCEEGDRQRMHRSVADALLRQERVVSPARLARHLELAKDDAAAARVYVDAAEVARRVYCNLDALQFYGRAQALLPLHSVLRFRIHEGRAQILRGMGRRRAEWTELEALRQHAERYGDAAMLALAFNRLARHWLDRGETAGVGELLEKALLSARSAGIAGAEVEALRLSAELALCQGDATGALTACEAALLQASKGADLLAARGSLLRQRAELLRAAGRTAEALETAAGSSVIFMRLGLKRNQSHALYVLGDILAESSDLPGSLAVLRQSIDLDREIGDRFHLGAKLANVGRLYMDMGQVERGRSFLERAIDLLERMEDPQVGRWRDFLATHLEGIGASHAAM